MLDSNIPAIFSTEVEYKVFRELAAKSKEYESFDELKAALVQVIKKYPKYLPAEYEPVDMLIWGRQQGWITSGGDGTFCIELPK